MTQGSVVSAQVALSEVGAILACLLFDGHGHQHQFHHFYSTWVIIDDNSSTYWFQAACNAKKPIFGLQLSVYSTHPYDKTHPTPGSEHNSSMSFGTSPSKLSLNITAAFLRYLSQISFIPLAHKSQTLFSFARIQLSQLRLLNVYVRCDYKMRVSYVFAYLSRPRHSRGWGHLRVALWGYSLHLKWLHLNLLLILANVTLDSSTLCLRWEHKRYEYLVSLCLYNCWYLYINMRVAHPSIQVLSWCSLTTECVYWC